MSYIVGFIGGVVVSIYAPIAWAKLQAVTAFAIAKVRSWAS